MKHIKIFETFIGQDGEFLSGMSETNPPVYYTGKPGDMVTVLLEDGGYVGILTDEEHEILASMNPREISRFPAEGKSFVVIKDYPFSIKVLSDDSDCSDCLEWINQEDIQNPNMDGDDTSTCYSIPERGKIIAAEADGHSSSVHLYDNVSDLISSGNI